MSCENVYSAAGAKISAAFDDPDGSGLVTLSGSIRGLLCDRRHLRRYADADRREAERAHRGGLQVRLSASGSGGRIGERHKREARGGLCRAQKGDSRFVRYTNRGKVLDARDCRTASLSPQISSFAVGARSCSKRALTTRLRSARESLRAFDCNFTGELGSIKFVHTIGRVPHRRWAQILGQSPVSGAWDDCDCPCDRDARPNGGTRPECARLYARGRKATEIKIVAFCRFVA